MQPSGSALTRTANAMQGDFPDPAPHGFQTRVNPDPRRGPILKLKVNQRYQFGDLSLFVESIDGDLITVKLSTGTTARLHAPAILFSPIGLHEG
jgi:hypothetical protein